MVERERLKRGTVDATRTREEDQEDGGQRKGVGNTVDPCTPAGMFDTSWQSMEAVSCSKREKRAEHFST